MALDRGANLRLAGQLPSPCSGLRDQSTYERGLGQNRHDPPYGAKARLSILRQLLNAEAFIAEATDTGLALPISPAPRDPSAHLPDNSGALSRDEAPVARGAWTDASISPVTAAKGPQVSARGICHAWSDDGANRAMRIAAPKTISTLARRGRAKDCVIEGPD
jgi:hypothetical protein